MATLDKMAASKGGKKKEGGMNAAVASTEKIRSWVSNQVFKYTAIKILNSNDIFSTNIQSQLRTLQKN